MKHIKYLKNIIFLIFGIISVFFIMQYFNEKKELKTSLKSASSLDFYRKQVIEQGDFTAYNELQFEYDNSDNFLYVALIMANKYDYDEAYYDVFYCLTRYSNKNKLDALDDLDNTTKAMALNYLIKGAAKGNNDCKRVLGSFYLQGKYVEKDIKKGSKLLQEAE